MRYVFLFIIIFMPFSILSAQELAPTHGLQDELSHLFIIPPKKPDNIPEKWTTGIVSLDQVLKSSAKNFPEIQIALARIEERRGGIQEAKGAFDAQLNNTTYNRFRGFFTGDFNDTQIVKPFQDFNAEVAVGYRISDGDFPIYQDYFFTNERGEASLKIALSLLRDRDIDPDRFKLTQSQLELNEAVIESLITKLNVQNKAAQAYLDWLTAVQSFSVYTDLLNIALKRDSALREKAARGDIPDIAVVENEQFILQRQEILASAKLDLDNTANTLSLFLRNNDNQPINVDLNNAPQKFPNFRLQAPENLHAEIERIGTVNPNILKIENQMELAENKIKLGENSLKPRLDLELYNAEDFGFGEFGSTTREGFESTVTVNLSIPLQQNLGRGQIAEGQAMMEQLKLEKNFQREQIRVSLTNLMNNIETAQRLVTLTSQEASVTRQMEEAERTRFDNGQSDFFLVNIREVNTANAKIKNILAQQNYAKTIYDFQLATVNFEAFGIDPNLSEKMSQN